MKLYYLGSFKESSIFASIAGSINTVQTIFNIHQYTYDIIRVILLDFSCSYNADLQPSLLFYSIHGTTNNDSHLPPQFNASAYDLIGFMHFVYIVDLSLMTCPKENVNVKEKCFRFPIPRDRTGCEH